MAKTTPGKTVGPDAETAIAVRTGLTADDGAINDTTYPVASATICAGWKSVRVQVVGTGGTVTTVTVTPLYRMGARWVAGTGVALADGASAVFDTMGRDVVFRVSSLTLNTATSFALWAGGWEPLPRSAIN